MKGRVQGVWFRDSTREQARRAGLTGYARNLPDGDVEVVASGDAVQLDELQAWLRRGPPLARVSDVIASTIEYRSFESFEVRR